jgi:cytidylate kinase
MIITIDGPAGSGKSTVAKQLAEKLGFIYVDTGAMYRAVTYYVLKNKISLEKPQQLQEVLDSLDLKISDENGEKQYLINNQDVTSYLRSKEVTSKVSPVSALLEVREKLVAIQRSYAEGIDAVLEGRDMGTVVFPDAYLLDTSNMPITEVVTFLQNHIKS